MWVSIDEIVFSFLIFFLSLRNFTQLGKVTEQIAEQDLNPGGFGFPA